MVSLRGLTTGIGSLPHEDTAEALDLVFRYCPQVPFWPQLPRRSPQEGMIAQFTEGLPCLEVTEEGVVFDAKDKEGELERFYENIIHKRTEYFKISPHYADGLYAFRERIRQDGRLRSGISRIKCHITGPFTLAAGIKDERGLALLHDRVFLQAIIEGLAMKALWQIGFFEEFGKEIIVFIDEPYLGCFGSAYTPVNREDVVKGLAELTQKISSRGRVLTGVHCCGNTDWSMFTEVPHIDIINFDAFGYLDKLTLYARELEGFFARGGALCWGIAPTLEFKGAETPESLLARIKHGVALLSSKGVPEQLIWRDLFVSPACGLGTVDVPRAQKVFALLAAAARLLPK